MTHGSMKKKLLSKQYVLRDELVPFYRKVNGLFVGANRFIFDKTASQKAGEVALNVADLVFENSQFAKAPYPTTFIELDYEAFWDVVNPGIPFHWDGSTYDGRRPLESESLDYRLGYLIHNNMVYCTSYQETNETPFYWSPVSIELNRPQTPLITSDVDWSDVRWCVQKMGSSIIHLFSNMVNSPMRVNLNKNKATFEWPKEKSEEIDDMLADGKIMRVIMNLINQHNIFIHPMTNNLPAEYSDKILYNSRGDLRNILTLLLLLNQPSNVVGFQKKAAGRMIVHGKLKAFSAHNVVTISLDKPVQYLKQTYITTVRSSPRRHDVRGHYLNYDKNNNCEHLWEQFDETHWKCKKCEQRRVWRDSYARGSALVGVLTKDYKVAREHLE
jgi:hypothetical protein